MQMMVVNESIDVVKVSTVIKFGRVIFHGWSNHYLFETRYNEVS